MKNWIPTNKFISSATTVAIFSMVLYFGSLSIVLWEIKKVENLYKNTESGFAKEEKSRLIKSIVEANKEDIQILRNFFVQKGDEVKFIEQIEEIGRKSGVTFEIFSIDVKGKEASSFKEDLSVKMNLRGSWSNVISFVDMLQKTYFGVAFQNINVNSDSLGHWSGSVEFIIFREK